jgi:hypothetical protein
MHVRVAFNLSGEFCGIAKNERVIASVATALSFSDAVREPYNSVIVIAPSSQPDSHE